MKISVAMAVYKGEKYIAEQLSSILSEIGENDEVVISDDAPGGETEKIIRSFADPRIRYIEGAGKGVTANFENALNHCTGDIIFLSDQDDVWLPGKVAKVVTAIESGNDLVLHDARITDENLSVISPSYFESHGSDISFRKTLIRNSFVGCCMAFRRGVLECALPFPGNVPMHDWWIALCALKSGYKAAMLWEPLILWRRHGDNVTGSPTTFIQKLRWRLTIIRCLSARKEK